MQMSANSADTPEAVIQFVRTRLGRQMPPILQRLGIFPSWVKSRDKADELASNRIKQLAAKGIPIFIENLEDALKKYEALSVIRREKHWKKRRNEFLTATSSTPQDMGEDESPLYSQATQTLCLFAEETPEQSLSPKARGEERENTCTPLGSDSDSDSDPDSDSQDGNAQPEKKTKVAPPTSAGKRAAKSAAPRQKIPIPLPSGSAKKTTKPTTHTATSMETVHLKPAHPTTTTTTTTTTVTIPTQDNSVANAGALGPFMFHFQQPQPVAPVSTSRPAHPQNQYLLDLVKFMQVGQCHLQNLCLAQTQTLAYLEKLIHEQEQK